MQFGAVAKHQYGVGDRVRLKRQHVTSAHKGADYRIIQLLPSNGGHNQYRIKCVSGSEERIVTEIELCIA